MKEYIGPVFPSICNYFSMDPPSNLAVFCLDFNDDIFYPGLLILVPPEGPSHKLPFCLEVRTPRRRTHTHSDPPEQTFICTHNILNTELGYKYIAHKILKGQCNDLIIKFLAYKALFFLLQIQKKLSNLYIKFFRVTLSLFSYY
jgi:hypothetical protein